MLLWPSPCYQFDFFHVQLDGVFPYFFVILLCPLSFHNTPVTGVDILSSTSCLTSHQMNLCPNQATSCFRVQPVSTPCLIHALDNFSLCVRFSSAVHNVVVKLRDRWISGTSSLCYSLPGYLRRPSRASDEMGVAL
ncbi:hypothetical protein Mapa_016931 [Marchantia paleacea]|nr:hypothetical protein Mapa_016931 [Marchantia paleacea]